MVSQGCRASPFCLCYSSLQYTSALVYSSFLNCTAVLSGVRSGEQTVLESLLLLALARADDLVTEELSQVNPHLNNALNMLM